MREGKLIRLRPVGEENLLALMQLRNELYPEGVFRQHRPLTMKSQREYYENFVSNPSNVVFVIVAPEFQERGGEISIFRGEGQEIFPLLRSWTVVGEVRLSHINARDMSCELGLFIGKKYQHRHYGTEALFLMLEHAFNDLNMHSIRAEPLADSHASRLADLFGFGLVGTTQGDVFVNGSWRQTQIREMYNVQWLLMKDALYEQYVQPHLQGATEVI